MLAAYLRGWFPMDEQEGAADGIRFYDAEPRAIIPLDPLRIPRSVRRAARVDPGRMEIDGDFPRVLALCAERTEGTWLSPRLQEAYVRLHEHGFAHSVEWRRDGRLVGGLFGVALGGLFTSESMFHRESDAGNLALAAAGAHLRERQFLLWDIQMLSPHTARFGAIEITGEDYRRRLAAAVAASRRFRQAV
jgi:leucyl/phenylalanyl-tRNA--protein transferase